MAIGIPNRGIRCSFSDDEVLGAAPLLELLNGRVLPRYTAWGLEFCAGIRGAEAADNKEVSSRTCFSTCT